MMRKVVTVAGIATGLMLLGGTAFAASATPATPSRHIGTHMRTTNHGNCHLCGLANKAMAATGDVTQAGIDATDDAVTGAAGETVRIGEGLLNQL